MSKPKNWPDTLPYLTSPSHDKGLTPEQQTTLRTQPNSLPAIPASSLTLPSPIVKITPIADPSHPAHGQSGLSATRDLKPGSFILPYLGRVHSSGSTDPDSDYDLWLDKEADLAVDASKSGNEARFVNDYRGVKERPNAEFGSGWAEKWGQVVVGFWVLRQGKKGKGEGIRKGEEIVVSYGKGFWQGRQAEGS